MAVRPETVGVHSEQPGGSPRNVWPVRVATIETRPDVVRLELAGQPSLAAVVTPAAVAELGLREGAQVWASVKAASLQAYPV